MLQVEKKDFIENRLKKLWSKWDFEEVQLKVWYGILSDFSFADACKAIEQVYATGHRFQNQLVPVFISAVKAIRQPSGRDRTKDEPVLLYRLFSEGNPQRVRRYYLNHSRDGIPSGRAILAEAEQKQKMLERNYGGIWRILRDWECEPDVVVDDGLRGREAFELAAARISAGPDSAGKRWLLKHLSEKPAKAVNIVKDFKFWQNRSVKWANVKLKPKCGTL